MSQLRKTQEGGGWSSQLTRRASCPRNDLETFITRGHLPLGILWILGSECRLAQLVFPNILALNPHEQRGTPLLGQGVCWAEENQGLVETLPQPSCVTMNKFCMSLGLSLLS